MRILSAKQIALFIPVTVFLHQLEEYFGGFPLWYSNLLGAELSDKDFILINGVGLFVLTAMAFSYFFTKSDLILVALGTLVFVNGAIHTLLSILTFTYSPGTITGIVLLIPLGSIIYKKIWPELKMQQRIIAVFIGISILLTASIIASNI